MLDIRVIREQPQWVNDQLQRRDISLSVDRVLAIDVRRREILTQEEQLRAERNVLTKRIATAKQAGQDTTAVQAQTKVLAETIKSLEAEKDALAEEQSAILLELPNLPLETVPAGKDEHDNVELRRWGNEFLQRPQLNQAHWDLAPALGLIDFERGVKVAQSRFSVLRGDGAKLARALAQLMLDTHAEHGYEEMNPPLLVNPSSMQGTGQLPKFGPDLFKCQDDDLYLIPTAEVPLTNLYRDEDMPEAQLPVQMAALTPCFRREAGSAGKDTRGLIRQHQFEKVELVHLTHPDRSVVAHAKLVADAERILQLLELPYRVMKLCTGDMGFSAASCLDIEVWLPGQQAYREISSCSNCWDFQARRANIKFRPADGGKLQFVHTLNGSGLAVGRTWVAVLENYQVSETEVLVPTVLQPYLKKSSIRLD